MSKNNNNKNQYVAKAKKKGFLTGISGDLPTKGNIKNTALETGKDLLVGVIGGGLIGAAIGKPSLIIGTIITGAGHYADNKLATIFGIGMMASNGFQKGKAVSGLDGIEGMKERMHAYKESFSEKLYLDKLVKAKAPVEGIGEIQYFAYPNDELQGSLAALDAIENEIEQSGLQFQGQLPQQQYEVADADFDDRNF